MCKVGEMSLYSAKKGLVYSVVGLFGAPKDLS